MQIKPLGRQGSWFATWNGEQLPCVHLRWTNGMDYLDPGYDGRRQWPKFISALANGGKAILTSSHVPAGDGPWRRDKYLSIWTVENVRVENGQLKFNYGEQLEQFFDVHGQAVMPTSQDTTTMPRNPNWNRDELMLALDLYLTNPTNPPGKESSEVAALSALLNKMHRLTGAAIGSTLRNPNGVYLKMMNLRALDPGYTAQGKVGMTSGGKLDKVIWDEYASQREQLAADAKAIRETIEAADEVAVSALPADEPYEGEEGGVVVRLHRRYERDRRLVAEKKKAAKAEGKLACEVCEFSFAERYGALGSDFIEVHHTKPVHLMTHGSKTRLADLALLCSNCHRMAHRKRLPLSLAELRDALLGH